MVATCCVATLALLKLRLPIPEAPSPMAVLLFSQEKVAPNVPVKRLLTGAPPHTATLEGWFTDGKGFTVMEKLWLGPGQPLAFGVTVMFPVVMATTFAAVNEMSPLPLGNNPIPTLLFVQFNVGLPVLENITSTGLPAQTNWFGGSTTVGEGLMVIVKVTGGPGHPLRMGITVMFATS